MLKGEMMGADCDGDSSSCWELHYHVVERNFTMIPEKENYRES